MGENGGSTKAPRLDCEQHGEQHGVLASQLDCHVCQIVILAAAIKHTSILALHRRHLSPYLPARASEHRDFLDTGGDLPSLGVSPGVLCVCLNRPTGKGTD